MELEIFLNMWKFLSVNDFWKESITIVHVQSQSLKIKQYVMENA